MKIIYQADDGKVFNDEIDCMSYEAGLKHPNLFKIFFFDSGGALYKIKEDNIFDEDIYQKAETIMINSEKEYEDFKWWVRECGWTEFIEYISGPGTWIRANHTNNYKLLWNQRARYMGEKRD